MWRHIKTWSIILVVTALIWVFAEAESLRSIAVPAAISIRAPADGSQFVDVLDDNGQPIPDGGAARRQTVALEGPAAAMTRAEALLRDGIVLSPGISEQFPSTRGTRELDLAAALRGHPDMRGLGVTIKTVEPPRVRIVVDDLVERRVPVAIELPDGQTDGPPTVTPAEVTVRLPSEAASRLDAPGAQAVARINRQDWDRLVPGRRETLTVVLAWPRELEGVRGVQLVPARATVDLTVRSRSDSITIPTVPVHIRLPASELERWDVAVVGRSLLTDVRVTGPSDAIQRIRAGAITVVAFVPLTFEDLERRITSKEASFSELPTALRFEPERALVELKITPRDAGTEAAPTP